MKTLPSAVLALAVAVSFAAQAAFPDAYAPVAVQPQISASGQHEFDLRPAQQRARREGKALYVYLGASDCAYCRKYEQFLSANLRELVPRFAPKYLVVDLRSQLSVTANQLILRTEAWRLPYADFQRAIGDQRARLLVYPSVWLLDATTGKPLMQMPAGTGTFQTVAEQIEILELVE
ncbi:thioredoxin family protein [Sphaerotilus montanus]|uniref:Thiol-disulfide isomerase/thioredoxin n=1 Tax=Sphaerotilus montanus TaxID=522889 RepID=A0A7Y9UD02_9BURK|nr:thioredoxin family protein [Sphaerotilus montanus]NYG34109.1 thiol-disulfide isomerase/thioredoxin [Sphaerotilus montanus]NZD55759.1 thioredoxin family protein [Sphaerotilus montanus]